MVMLRAHVCVLFCVCLVPGIDGVPGAMDSMSEMMSRSPVQMVPNTASFDAASELIKGIARIPAPDGTFFKDKVDPVLPGEDSCDRDTNEICPESWVNVGPIKGGSTEYCHAGSQYFGPCADELQSFADMSAMAIKRWSRGCQAYFPCRSCRRDYQKVCPDGWARLGNERKCKPLEDYAGPCRGTANLAGHNIAMLEEWSDLCGAYWPCQQIVDSNSLYATYPISIDATLARIARGLQ